MGLSTEFYQMETDFGYGILRQGTEQEEADGIVFLDTLIIKMEHRDRGRGGFLLEELLDAAGEFEYTTIIVFARSLLDDAYQEALNRFYENHGFEKSTDYASFHGQYFKQAL